MALPVLKKYTGKQIPTAAKREADTLMNRPKDQQALTDGQINGWKYLRTY
jgi:hypothetical protein